MKPYARGVGNLVPLWPKNCATVNATRTTFYDRDGTPIRVEVHVNWDGTVSNSVTGKTLCDPGHYKRVFDLKNGTVSAVGLVYGITIRGQGTGVFEVGKITFDANGNISFDAGPTDWNTYHGNSCPVCEALR